MATTTNRTNNNSKISNSLVKKDYSKIGKCWLTTALMIPMLNLGLLPTPSAKAQMAENGTYQIAQVDPWVAQVRSQLRRVANIAGYNGYSLTHDFFGNLRDNYREDVTFNLRSGKTYRIIGVCDNDCSDLDLKIYDANGNLIASDTLRDSQPIISVRPKWDSAFTVRATMVSCSSSPCRYGIGAFAE